MHIWPVSPSSSEYACVSPIPPSPPVGHQCNWYGPGGPPRNKTPRKGGWRGPRRGPPPWKVPLCSWARAFCFVFVPNGGLVGAYSERAPDLLFLRVGGHGWASNARFWLPSKWPELQVWICPGESPRRPAINNEGGVCRLCSFQCTMHIGPVSPNSPKYAPISPTLPSPFVGRQYNW